MARRRRLERPWLCLLAAAVSQQAHGAVLSPPTAEAAQLNSEPPQLPALPQVIGSSMQTFASASASLTDMAKEMQRMQAAALTELAQKKASYDQHLVDEHNVTRTLKLDCQGVAQDIRKLQSDIHTQDHEVASLQKQVALFQKQLRGAQAALARLSGTRRAPADDDASQADDTSPAAQAAAAPAAPLDDQDAAGSPQVVVDAAPEDGTSATALEADDAGDAEDAEAGGGYGVLSLLATDSQASVESATAVSVEALQSRLQSLGSVVAHARDLQLSSLTKMRSLFEAELAKEKHQQDALRAQLAKLRAAKQGLIQKKRKLDSKEKTLKAVLKQVSLSLGIR